MSGKGKEKATASPTTESKSFLQTAPRTFKVVAGSYEKILYGIEGSTSFEGDDHYAFHLKPIFAFPAHVSCIKAVSASPNGGKWLVTGSADEIIKVWDLRRRKEIGGLMHHEGSITYLCFPSQSHLISASEDGTLCLFRARDWVVLRSLKGHKGRINSVAVHPSGKVALSVGVDKTLRMWDLMRGRGSASTKLGKEGEVVRWSVDGTFFAVQAHSIVDIYATDMTLIHTINHPSRLHDLKFCRGNDKESELLLACAEDKKVSIYTIAADQSKPPKLIAVLTGHTNRVKAVDTLSIALPPLTKRASTIIACTVSSDGKIHIYDIAQLSVTSQTQANPGEISPAAVYDTKGTRLTCVTLADGEPPEDDSKIIGKRRRSQDDHGQSDEYIALEPQEVEEMQEKEEDSDG